jgi:hypothetical protein
MAPSPRFSDRNNERGSSFLAEARVPRQGTPYPLRRARSAGRQSTGLPAVCSTTAARAETQGFIRPWLTPPQSTSERWLGTMARVGR